MVNNRYIAADFGPISLAFLRWGIALFNLTPFAIKYLKADWQKTPQTKFAASPLCLYLSVKYSSWLSRLNIC